MKSAAIYDVRVIDETHAVTVMAGITVAPGLRAAARQMCDARFGKWTGATRVQVSSLCGNFSEEFPFAEVAPADYE